jgi:hypothetical protein
MAVIGCRKAVVDLRRFCFYGLPTWLMWDGIHILPLKGLLAARGHRRLAVVR